MEDLLARHLVLVRQLRKQRTTITIENITKLFDDIIEFLNTTDRDSYGLSLLATVSHELASLHTLQLFDNPNIIDHELFIFMRHTFEMLLTKSNYLQYVKMTSEEEQCFYELSYLIAHLCLYRNESLLNFYTRSTTKHLRELEPPVDRKTSIAPAPESNHQQTLAHITKKYENLSYEDVFLNKEILFKLAYSISDLAKNEYAPYHVKYKVIDCLVRLCSKLTEIDLDLLLDPITQCLHSKFYLTTFNSVNLRQPIFDPKQSFFIRECFDFIGQHGYKKQTKIAEELCKPMLENTTIIFSKYLPIIIESNDITERPDKYGNEKGEEKGARMQALSYHLKLLNYFALTPSTRKEFMTGTIIGDILSLLSTPSLVKSVHRNKQLFHVDVGVIAWSLTLLYNLIFNKDIFKKLKEKKETIHICEQLHTALDDTIHFTAQTLLTLLKQKDIDDIEDPYRLTKSYLYYIKNTMDQPNQTFHGIQLANTLQNFETICQNDDVKEKIVEDERGIQLLAECVYDPKFDEKTVQQPAMRIIFTVSFVGEHAIEKIKDIDLLISNIIGATKSIDLPKERTANGIMWNLENEKMFIEKTINEKNKEKELTPPPPTQPVAPPSSSSLVPTSLKVKVKGESTYEYIRGDFTGWGKLSQPPKPIPIPEEPKQPDAFDLMISYCHAQRDICHRMHDSLVHDQFKVWIDKENMYGSVLESMAEAIERSNIVLMCMSNKYKESNACQLEAKYAWKRKKKIIPVKVEEKYDPTGWLGLLCSDDSYIDFCKLGFDKAYKELLKEIKMIKNSDRK